jgi:hypothetical protein
MLLKSINKLIPRCAVHSWEEKINSKQYRPETIPNACLLHT